MEQVAQKKRMPTTATVLKQQAADAERDRAKAAAAKLERFAKPAESATTSTESATPETLPATVAPAAVAAPEHADAFQQYADAVAPRVIVGKLLKFSKGDYVAGEGGEEVKEGTRFIAIMDELWTGFVLWRDNKPIEHRIGRVIDKFVPPQRRELGYDNKEDWPADDRGETRDPWQFTNYLVMKSSDDAGEFYTFSTGTRGGLNAVADLCRHYARDVKQHPDCFPVIALKVSSYDHPIKAYGRVKIPVLSVVGRAPRDGVQLPVAKDMDEEIPF